MSKSDQNMGSRSPKHGVKTYVRHVKYPDIGVFGTYLLQGIPEGMAPKWGAVRINDYKIIGGAE